MPQLNELDFCFLDTQESLMYFNTVINTVTTDERPSRNTYRSRLGTIAIHYEYLLNKMLQFNPYMRWSARECLEMDVFRTLKESTTSSNSDYHSEASPLKVKIRESTSKIMLKVDMEGVFDYETVDV